MKFQLNIIFPFFIIFCFQFYFTSVEALSGQNVRLAKRKEFPYLVSFMDYTSVNPNPSQDHFCTGSLISKQHVLSAAHCITHKLRNETIVLSGTNNLVYGRVYFILWWISFNEWTWYKRMQLRFEDNDISISKLNQMVDRDIPAGIISPLSNLDLHDLGAVVAGWGRSNDEQVSIDLLTGKVRILTLHECESRIKQLQGFSESLHIGLLCTIANPYVLLRDGDFGGPVIVKNKIVGVNKETRPFKEVDFNSNKVNIHTSIDYYRDFIADTTRFSFNWESN